MSADKEKKMIIQFIKEYYDEHENTPSMKEILSGCKVNPRVFYELFDSKEKACSLAGVPYSDEPRLKVEKANITRKFGKIGIIETRSLPPLKVINRDYISNKEDKYVKKCNLMLEKLSNICSKYRQLNPGEMDYIIKAYDRLSSFIMYWYTSLSIDDKQYELAKSLRYSTDPYKFMFISIGYDFNNLEGSYHELCEKKINKMISDEESHIFDAKTREYFKAMLGEVFGIPPDLTVDK